MKLIVNKKECSNFDFFFFFFFFFFFLIKPRKMDVASTADVHTSLGVSF